MRIIRYRQVLRQRIGNTGGLYKYQVRLQQSFWIEDKAPAWTIPQVREIHISLGTWDKHCEWVSYRHHVTKEMRNYLNIWTSPHKLIAVYLKANYKPIRITCEWARNYQEARWKEQEQRTLEFFEREGC